MLYKVESKGYISIPKFSPNILKRFLNYLIKIGNNKELLNSYKDYIWAELKFYLVILVIVLCVFTYNSYNINDVSKYISNDKDIMPSSDINNSILVLWCVKCLPLKIENFLLEII